MSEPIALSTEDVTLLEKLLHRLLLRRKEVERNWKPGLPEGDEDIARLTSIIKRASSH